MRSPAHVMARSARRLGGAAAMIVLLALAAAADAQTLYLSGQNVQPAFEGWMRNADGTFTMVFGYLNRNYVEEPNVPVGPDNFFEPGALDRGQPTHFYPRRQQFLFEVIVPADWGQKDLVWTVTHNGRTSTAIGSLSPVWEIDEGVMKVNRNQGGNFGRTAKVIDPNHRPSATIVGESAVTVVLPQTVTLTVATSDDGKPGPRASAARSSDELPKAPTESATGPTDGLPTLSGQASPIGQDVVKARAAYETGLAVTWLHYRGTGTVTFQPRVVPVPLHDGKATTTVSFSESGIYVIRAVADDGVLTTPADITVIVKPASTSGR